jgi:predicted CXXCH cytochrome family protein
VSLMGKMRSSCLLFLWFLTFAPFVFCQSSEVCLMCHGNRALTMKRRGQTVSLFVDSSHLKNSIHAAMTCVDCHRGFNPGAMPHAKVINPVRCQTCHNVPGFEKSVHGVPLFTTGADKTATAGCKTCHGTHEIRASKDPKSLTNKLNVSRTCAKCHEEEQREYLASAHGPAAGPGAGQSPSCVDCHGAHRIVPVESTESPLFRTKEARVCLKCHLDNPEIRKQVGTSAGFIASYESSVHGIALASGNQTAATCSDCHGAHDLKKARDPSSRMSRWNIADTCSRCHSDIARVYNESIHGTALRN